ncbi:prolyl 4-hydroxylase subunit alpha-1-like [Watersipora subatra]|uniref:prolyl 4-hydroxylase subunit alpha-1-like n=1 Tax=Watersipora subatra TaxID=2589382 RepID=UPI00355AD353
MVPLFLLFYLNVQSITADSFTSLVHLQQSIDAESDIVSYINTYVRAEFDRLAQLEGLAVELADHHKLLKKGNTERHLSNPVNAFLLTRQMHDLVSDSVDLIESKSQGNTVKYMQSTESLRSRLPSKDDMDGAVLALLRLQDTYSLNTSQLSDSNLGLSSPADEAPPLSGDDCFKIGQTAFLMDDFYHSVLWFQTALEKYEMLDGSLQWVQRKLTSTFDYLNFSLYKQGNIERAISIATRWTEIAPGAQPGTDNLYHYRNELNETGRLYDPYNLPPLQNQQLVTGFAATQEFKKYTKLCQGQQLPKSSRNSKQLVCKYRPIQFSYFPSEEEELHLEPRLVYIHRIISDREIQVVQALAKPKLDRSGVFATNAATPLGGIKTHTRVSKSAWLGDEEDETIALLSRRFARVTGLTVGTAESLQVLNYGIGGHYEPHCDFARPDNPNVFDHGVGNRIATLILYLTDVEKGGATVFPRLEAAVWPLKGGAAFWYNLDENGALDERTLHGACPVLAGYKWVCNKWFHESGNEFTRPCPASS